MATETPHKRKRILIVNTSIRPERLEYVTPIKEKLSRTHVDIIHFKKLASNPGMLNRYGGVIISGQPLPDPSHTTRSVSKSFSWLKKVNIPVLGICGGHQIIALIYGGKLVLSEEKEGVYEVRVGILKDYLPDKIFAGLNLSYIYPSFRSFSYHRDSATLPLDFVRLASTPKCKNSIIRHRKKPIYGIQFHPENPHFRRGLETATILLENFESIVLGEFRLDVAKAFVSQATKKEVVDYFKARRKKKRLGVFGYEEKIEEIDRRYLPVACFEVMYLRGEEIEKTRAYVDLYRGVIYWVNKGKIEKDDMVRRIMGLPAAARELLLSLIRYGEINEEHIAGKDINLLKKKGLVKLKAKDGGKGIFVSVIDEILDLVRISSRSASEFGGKSSQAETLYRDQKEKEVRVVRHNFRHRGFDRRNDLETYVTVEDPKNEFDPENAQYDSNDVARILDAIAHGESDIVPKYLVYLPSYLCTYSGYEKNRYLRYSLLKFMTSSHG